MMGRCVWEVDSNRYNYSQSYDPTWIGVTGEMIKCANETIHEDGDPKIPFGTAECHLRFRHDAQKVGYLICEYTSGLTFSIVIQFNHPQI